MLKNNDDTKKLLQYIKLWVDSLRAREKGDESTEDILLENLDTIWFSMTDTQMSLINSLSERLVNNKITLDHLEKKYSKRINGRKTKPNLKTFRQSLERKNKRLRGVRSKKGLRAIAFYH